MIGDERILELVKKVGIATDEVLAQAKIVADQEHKSVTDILIERGITKPEELGQLLANDLKVKFIDLRKENITPELLSLIPEVVASSKHAVVFKRDAEGLKVAMADPSDYSFAKLLEKKVGENVLTYFSLPVLIDQSLASYRKDIRQQFEEIIKVNVLKARGVKAEDVSIIRIVDTLVEYGYRNNASDIHVEPHREDVIVRFRIDGALHDVLTLPSAIHDLVVTRVKILSKLRTDVHRSAQDGKLIREIDGHEVDVRVSILPTTQGEKVVMRLLTPDDRLTSLEELGLNPRDLEKVRRAAESPHGMILSTGPTGSGKTTTLYSLIRIVNKRDVNISTVEDPVEYYLDGVNQVQVSPKTNLTFAAGLRSLLRQDPDIIMVGEIRDEETASIAINAAMTGHLVLSTMHTNDAATALPRLYDMHIEPFLIASTVNIIIAQRLVRKICTQCISSYSLSEAELKRLIGSHVNVEKYLYDGTLRAYKGKGCVACSFTGYRGRIGVFEVIEMNDAVRQLVVGKASADKIAAAAVASGMITMAADGIDKVAVGKTTLDELIRVVKG